MSSHLRTIRYILSNLQDELKQYWSKPFVVKSYLGYWTWPKTERVRMVHKIEDFTTTPDSVRSLISQFFLDENLVARLAIQCK
jgi:hypothetical protein